MRTNWKPRVALVPVVAMLVGLSAASAFAQTPVKAGFNLFSPEQDVEIGRQSAAQAERQLPILGNSSADRYVEAIGRRLAAVAPGPKFPYTFKVVNAADINAFALPGGPTYVTRGLIESVPGEAELAGVIAHEIAHVALRHGTNNASKAYLAQAGIGILGGVLGGGGGATGQIIQAVGGLGLNALFLKFSRSAETQADIVGTQMLAKAGY
ncbi:MAG: M48 family metalloprotease, partial [Acidobacteriota bacterium]